jgi:RNA polymerase sigma-70 factor (ECF subfamily)
MEPSKARLCLNTGELEPFNRLVKQHQDEAYTLAYRVLGDPAWAEEATQAAALHAYQNLLTYPAATFKLRLLHSVAAACQQRMRLDRWLQACLQRGLRARTEGVSRRTPRQPQPTGDPIQDRLNRLPPAERLAVVLVDVLGLDYEQAAQVLEEPKNHFRRHLARARRRIIQVPI